MSDFCRLCKCAIGPNESFIQTGGSTRQHGTQQACFDAIRQSIYATEDALQGENNSLRSRLAEVEDLRDHAIREALASRDTAGELERENDQLRDLLGAVSTIAGALRDLAKGGSE